MNANQAERTAANRKARIERELKRAGFQRRRGKIPRGTTRKLLRDRWALGRTKVSVKVPGWGTDKRTGMPIQIEITKEVWKPTFAEWRKLNVKED